MSKAYPSEEFPKIQIDQGVRRKYVSSIDVVPGGVRGGRAPPTSHDVKNCVLTCESERSQDTRNPPGSTPMDLT